MNNIEAIIKPFQPGDAGEALSGLGVEGLTVSKIKGFGRQRGHMGENPAAGRGTDAPGGEAPLGGSERKCLISRRNRAVNNS